MKATDQAGVRRTREEIVSQVRDVMRRVGYGGATLRVLSEATALQRASLYHHFPGGKAEMATAALTSVERALEEDFLFHLRRGGAPEHRLEAMLAALDAHYAGGQKGCLLAVLALERGEHGLSDRVAAALRLWIAAFTALARETGGVDPAGRAEEALAAIQGGLLLSIGLGDPGPFRRALRRCPEILLGGTR